MARQNRGRVAAGALSLLVPGAGQIYVGARRRGLVLLAVTAALGLVALVLLLWRPLGLAGTALGPRLLAGVLAVDLVLLAFRLFAIVDAWRLGREAVSWLAVAGLAGLVAIAVAPHAAAGYATVRSYAVLDAVFAEEEPRDVLPAQGLFLVSQPAVRPVTVAHPLVGRGVLPAPGAELRPVRVARAGSLEDSRRVLGRRGDRFEHPWVTILLLGTDRGPGNWGERTDTIIVAVLQRDTGRAAAFGVPRNLVQVPIRVAGQDERRFREPLNALYQYARFRPELFPGGRDPGATALKQTVSRLLGIRVDYYALVDLKGFADLVDALGGVEILVKERLDDSLTRAAWGEPKPTIDVNPGQLYRFFGQTALAYVRSRKTSSDYARMSRQRCFLSALARQLDVRTVLRHFPSLAATVQASVRTDIPLARVPDLIRLAAAIEPGETLTETFGLRYFAGRRASDRYPIPNIPKIQATVRDVILRPAESRARRGVASAQDAC